MRLNSKDSTVPGLFEVDRDSVIFFSGIVYSRDTLLRDTSLLPGSLHSYKGYKFQESIRFDSTKLLKVRMMDTTSHEYSWRIDTLGDGSSSFLRDVAIINDTCIFAVGAIYFRDSTGNFDPLPYNVAKWNGKKWGLMRATVSYLGNPITFPLEGIFAISPSDIWVMGGVPIHWDGVRWTMYHLPDMGINVDVSRAWARTPTDIYFVGIQGSIAHFDGRAWSKIESGTTLQIQDIWGAYGDTSNNSTILAIASNKNFDQGKLLLRLQGLTATPSPDAGLIFSLSGIWLPSSGTRYIVGGGLFEQEAFSNDLTWKKFSNGVPQHYAYAIRGVANNDFALAGEFGEIWHFNGYSWRSYSSEISLPFGLFTGISVSPNSLCAVGVIGNKAVVALGRR